jgi:type II secretory pathway pseudopilin PulG
MGKIIGALICIIALLAGSVFYFWANFPDVAQEARQTDQITGGIDDSIETVTERLKVQDTQTRTEVRVIRETVRTKVNALLPDSVASGLNAELALFRGMEAGAGELDGD